MSQSERHSRTELLIGAEGVARLRGARVAVFGLGGVGGYAVEALCRAGIGTLDLIDADTVSVSNINRQIIATENTVGRYKTELMRERIGEIDSTVKVNIHTQFYPDGAEPIDLREFDYIVDAIDSVPQKCELIRRASELSIPIISSMGAGGKLDPCAFKVADIYESSVCPLAKTMRRHLREMGVKSLKVVYSTEPPLTASSARQGAKGSNDGSPVSNAAYSGAEIGADGSPVSNAAENKRAAYLARSAPGSISFIPSVVGLILASEVIKDIALR